MIKSSLFLSIIAVSCVFFALPAGAQNGKMYSYTDENGTVVFTDKLPPDRNVQSEPIPPGPPPQGANPYAQADTGQPASSAQQRREEIAQGRRDARMAQAEQAALCSDWQAEVDRLEPNRRHFYTNDEGETVRMDDVERVNRVAELKQKIAADCG